MRKAFLLVAFILLVFGMVPAFAQTEEASPNSPLVQMLARIPDLPGAHEFLTYVDYRALIAARPGAPQVASWQEFESYRDGDTKAGALLMSALNGVRSGPQFFTQNLLLAGDMQQVVGFDPFSIERAVEYGLPPATVTILEGEFDSNAVIAAHEQRGYTEAWSTDLTLLCGANGCEHGTEMNLVNRNPANPFGGTLGRSQPVLVGDHLVASSPSNVAVNAVASAVAGDVSSLADQPDYRAAAEAISASGTLLQTYFIAPTDIAPASTAIMDAMLSDQDAKAALNALQADFVPVSQYNLVALADAATDDEELTLVALVYTNAADAEAAAALFPAHLEQAEGLRYRRTFGDILTERGVTSIDATVYPASTDRYVMLLTLHAPLPDSAVTDGTPPPAMSLAYAALTDAYFYRDLGWLATQF